MTLPLTSLCCCARRDDRVLSSKIALTGGGLARMFDVDGGMTSVAAMVMVWLWLSSVRKSSEQRAKAERSR